MDSTNLKQRLAAILAADAAGYSRLMSLDEHATVAALDAARRVFRAHIESNQGRVIDMAGDSVLAVFETATGAVTAALAVQSELAARGADLAEDRRMRFRIGVHLGDLIEKADGTVYGDGVNIAARLQGLAEPGGITVSDAVHGAVRGKLEAAFEDQGEQQVKNIAYAIRAYAVSAQVSPSPLPSPASGRGSSSATGIDLSLPDKPSIAVLPFDNMSGDPEQVYFTDGITEDIITELSRFQSLFVIARNSSFTYKGKAVDVKQIGKELGVRYVVEGSIRRAGNRVRVTAQLIDSFTGSHLWAEKFDRMLEDIFAVQEEVTECIVSAIAPQVDAAEAMRARRRPGNLSAYEMAMRAASLFNEGYPNSDDLLCVQALELARAALAIDPTSLPALLVVAAAQNQRLLYRTATDREQAWQEGMEAANRGITLAQSNMCHAIKGHLLTHAPSGPRWEEARLEAETAHRLNPQDAVAVGICAMLLAQIGDAAPAIGMLERALRISPRDPFVYNRYAELALAHFVARDYAKGLEWALRASSAAPDFPLGHLFAAALHVGLGEFDKARAPLEVARRLAPELVQARLKARPAGSGTDFQRRNSVFLRIAAGLEDPAAADAFRPH